ncbi:EF-hand domain-containing protein [Plasmodiophora brassicae]
MVGGDHVATDEEMLELKTIFELVDRDRCGTIDRSELKLLMSILRIPMTEDEIEALIKQMDKNQDGVIQFDEFAAASTKKVDTMDPDQVLRAFRSFSKTPDKGRINVADLEEALTTDGSPPLSQEQAQSIIQQLDVNKNGDFKYAEYVRTLIHRRPPPHVSLRSLHRRQSSRLSLNAPPSLTRWTSMAQ